MAVGAHQEYKAEQNIREKSEIAELTECIENLQRKVNNISKKIDELSETKYKNKKK
jgi:predicted RNase H-like nuclease (RuvC/YqgF family)